VFASTLHLLSGGYMPLPTGDQGPGDSWPEYAEQQEQEQEQETDKAKQQGKGEQQKQQEGQAAKDGVRDEL
jgi:hypothetical protein